MPNPIKSQLPKLPTLQRRRARGAECTTCPAVIKRTWASESLGTLRNRLDNEARFQDVFDGTVETYEARRNGEHRGTKRRKIHADGAKDSDDAGDDSSDDGVGATTVSAQQVSQLEARKFLGVLWPLKIYSKDNGEPDKSEIQTIVHCGQSVKGVLKSRDFGMAQGCIELWSNSASASTKSTLMHASGRALRPDETSDIWKATQKRLQATVSVKDGKDGQPGPVHLSMPKMSATKKKNGEDDGDDLWDDLWELPSGKAAPVEADGGECQDGKKRRKCVIDINKPSRVAVGKMSPSTSSKSNKEISTSKLSREVQVTEAVLLSCDQLLRSAKVMDTLRVISIKQIESSATRVSARMTPPLMTLYTQDYDPSTAALLGSSADGEGDNLSGMACLERLRKSSKRLLGLKPLIVELNGKGGGQELKAAMEEARLADIILPDSLLELVAEREIQNKFAAKEWTEFMDLLFSWSSESSSMSALPVDRQAELQRKMLAKAFCDVLPAQDNLADTMAFTGVVIAQMASLNSGPLKDFKDEVEGTCRALFIILQPYR